jgi:hypothetical protein
MTGQARGFAFVEMQDVEGARRARFHFSDPHTIRVGCFLPQLTVPIANVALAMCR